MYMVAGNEQQLSEIKNWVREYRKREIREGMKLFSLPLNEVI